MRLSWIMGALALAWAGQAAAQTAWVASWAAPPAPAMTSGTGRVATMVSPAFNNQTVVERLRLSAGGLGLRLRFTNEYGTRPLAIGRARVALLDAEGKVVPGSARDLAFAGKASAVVPPHAPLFSDPVDLTTMPLARLQVSLYLPGQTEACPCHGQGGDKAEISPPGDFTDRAFTPVGTTENRVFLSGVEVARLAPGPARRVPPSSSPSGTPSPTASPRPPAPTIAGPTGSPSGSSRRAPRPPSPTPASAATACSATASTRSSARARSPASTATSWASPARPTWSSSKASTTWACRCPRPRP